MCVVPHMRIEQPRNHNPLKPCLSRVKSSFTRGASCHCRSVCFIWLQTGSPTCINQALNDDLDVDWMNLNCAKLRSAVASTLLFLPRFRLLAHAIQNQKGSSGNPTRHAESETLETCGGCDAAPPALLPSCCALGHYNRTWAEPQTFRGNDCKKAS